MQALGGSTQTCRPAQRATAVARAGHAQTAKRCLHPFVAGTAHVAGAARHVERSIICSSSSSGMSLLGNTTSDVLKKAEAKGPGNVDAVPLESDAGIDYTSLREHLKAGDIRKADDDTRALLIKLAGPAAVKRNWVYFSEVQFIPAKDLQTIDALWRAASNNKFGYSIQKEIWLQNQKRWAKFFKAIDWVQGDDNVYRKWPAEFNYSLDAARGHMPLTNALRGTQLFEALLTHPAFDKSSAGKSIDELSKAAAANTLKW